ncbi:predicted protein [Plenodomus lingam JN3]|uniref:Predicted protein n=1 Tax=Leptosphaeria maculans (strain JN3 / isolate v23.1.3 / race Av1-4-5-6-7-8) TaxID=985895 RepID=E5A4U6_LEPMJ|nr:predicted protein [Plenodomus lingam JN3]CBX98644.1 predicted protein [Plenodomus lingam JN3]
MSLRHTRIEGHVYTFGKRIASGPFPQHHGVSLHYALGTPLDWPEAKKVADQVRSWGIEVCDFVSIGLV